MRDDTSNDGIIPAHRSRRRRRSAASNGPEWSSTPASELGQADQPRDDSEPEFISLPIEKRGGSRSDRKRLPRSMRDAWEGSDATSRKE